MASVSSSLSPTHHTPERVSSFRSLIHMPCFNSDLGFVCLCCEAMHLWMRIGTPTMAGSTVVLDHVGTVPMAKVSYCDVVSAEISAGSGKFPQKSRRFPRKLSVFRGSFRGNVLLPAERSRRTVPDLPRNLPTSRRNLSPFRGKFGKFPRKELSVTSFRGKGKAFRPIASSCHVYISYVCVSNAYVPWYSVC